MPHKLNLFICYLLYSGVKTYLENPLSYQICYFVCWIYFNFFFVFLSHFHAEEIVTLYFVVLFSHRLGCDLIFVVTFSHRLGCDLIFVVFSHRLNCDLIFCCVYIVWASLLSRPALPTLTCCSTRWPTTPLAYDVTTHHTSSRIAHSHRIFRHHSIICINRSTSMTSSLLQNSVRF